MKAYVVLALVCLTLPLGNCKGTSENSIKKDYSMMKDIVRLCSRYCASRPAPDCANKEPVLYAPLDEIQGTASPGVNVEVKVFGDNPDPSIVNGHKGKAIHLPNSGTYDDHYLDLGSHTDQCIDDIDKCENGYTISFWYRNDEGNHPWPVLAAASDWQVWNQDSPKGNAPYMSWYKKDGKRYVMGGNTFVTDEEWHHIAIVARSRTDVKFFIDGNLDASELRYDRPEKIKYKSLEIGCYRKSNCIAAAFDEVKIWEEAKSDEEIKDIYLDRYKR